MTIVNDGDIHYGAGCFEQAMRSQTDIPGRDVRMTPGVAIGILSAAMRSGLPAARFSAMIDAHFAHGAQLLTRMLDRYEGNNWDIDLWHLLATERYKLATELCRPGIVQWRYDASAGRDD